MLNSHTYKAVMNSLAIRVSLELTKQINELSDELVNHRATVDIRRKLSGNFESKLYVCNERLLMFLTRPLT